MNLREGALLHNNTYRVERVLGQGGFGITYLAVHVRLHKKVAIKEFFPKAFCDREQDTNAVRTASKANTVTIERLRNKFIKEAEHIAGMDSPYIVRIIDVFEENNTAYYIMDYIEGESLSQIVKTSGPLPVKQAVEYVSRIGDALTYIHSKRMNHLDVKPANIMIRTKDNVPVLIDFGLSKQYDTEGNQTSTTPVGISHGYAPIEQYRDGGVTEFSPQTDLYSLAATLYFLLTGTVPPQASALVEDELTFPASFPKQLAAPIRKAMSSSRKSRHESIAAFIAEITSAVNTAAVNNGDTANDEDTVIVTDTKKAPDTGKTTDLPEANTPSKRAASSNKVHGLGFIIPIAAIVAIIGIIAYVVSYKGKVSVNPEQDSIANADSAIVAYYMPDGTPQSYSAAFFEDPSNRCDNCATLESRYYTETKSGLKIVQLDGGYAYGNTPQFGDNVTLDFKVRDPDDNIISEEHGCVMYLDNHIIPGLAEGLKHMREGSLFVLYIPPKPELSDSDTPLICEIKLISVASHSSK